MQVGKKTNCLCRFLFKLWKLAKDDPRRVVHSLKVGLAITIVSALYYVTPLFKGFGDTSMWSVATVVLVMEFTVGATLTRGLNRAFATLMASALGIMAHYLAVQCGDKPEPFLLGILVFIIAVTATFARFIPELKVRYDYGVMIFILTFCFVAVSSYRYERLLELAYRRITTISIGVFVALFTSILVFPVWAGEEFHKLVAGNLYKMAIFLEGFGNEYFTDKIQEQKLEDKTFLQAYRFVLNSKATEENLSVSAKWEPCHGKFGFYHPWRQYQRLGELNRRCAYFMEVLNACFAKTMIETLTEEKFSANLRQGCLELTCATGKVLGEVALSMQSMKKTSTTAKYLDVAITAADELNMSMLKEFGDSEAQPIQLVTIISLLIEIAHCTKHIVGCFEELATIAKFKTAYEEELQQVTIVQGEHVQGSHPTDVVEG